MKTHLDCIPCFLKQSLEAARMVTDDEKKQEHVLKDVMSHLKTINFENSPPEISREVHEIIRSILKNDDPYKNVKKNSNEEVKKKYNYLKDIVEKSDDPLLMAVKLAIVGNVIDFGTINRFNLEEMIDRAVNRDFDMSSYDSFKKSLEESETILFLADNTGEIFFDKILLEHLVSMNKKITYVVKSNPIINDATIEDASYAGINMMVDIMNSDDGQNISSPGLILRYASDEFLKKFNESDMVISKGQGNFEGLSDCDRKVFFLLVAKCPLVAGELNCEVGKLILK